MLRRWLCIAIAAAITTIATAQEVTIVECTQLCNSSMCVARYPMLSSTGKQLLFTCDQGHTLNLYRFDDKQITSITHQLAPDQAIDINQDEQVYFYVTASSDTTKRYIAKRYDLATHITTEVEITTSETKLSNPSYPSHSMSPNANTQATTPNIGTCTWANGQRVYVIVGHEQRVFAPVDSWASYLWPTLSPDGKHIAFFAVGKGIVVIDLRGQITAMLGNYEMPSWYNNDYLIAQHTLIDEHQTPIQQLMLLKADGSWQQALSLPTVTAMHPTCGGGKIAYVTHEGSLYVASIQIDE